MLNRFYFTNYYEDGEIYSKDKIGEYWKFVELDLNALLSMNFMCSNLCKITSKIQNIELKSKMKEKVSEYIKKIGVIESYFEYSYQTKIFSVDEAIDIIKNDKFINDITDKKYDKDNPYFASECKSYISTCSIIDDIKFQSEQAFKIFDEIITLDNRDSLIIRVLNGIQNSNIELFNVVFIRYYNYIPAVYKKFIEASNDNEYIYKKSLKFARDGIRIGIDPRIKIGVEIETNHPYYLVFNCSNQDSIRGLYKTEDDPTVPDGVEIVSKPFYDNTSDVSKFCALCETLAEVGYSYNEEVQNASGQINLGLDYLDSSQSIINFYELFCNVEELLFYISNGNNQLIRQDLYRSSRIKPISEIIGIRDIDEDISRDDLIKMFNNRFENESSNIIHGLSYKKNTICLRGTSESDYRFEVRIPNGGNDYRIWIDNIRLYGKMMEVSKHMADLKNEDYLSDNEESQLNIMYDLKYKKLELDEKLILLMDLLFDDPEIKNIYFKRYINTVKKIDETHTHKYYVPYALKQEPMFGRVNLEQKPSSKINDEPVVSYDPKTGEYIEYGKRKARF